MCLFPKLILNRKYLPTRKNGFNPPPIKDMRTTYVPVGCGKCIECKKQKAREWKIRLAEELKVNNYAYFVTFTFSEQSLEALCKEFKHTESNFIAGKAIRRYLERWRKIYGKSQRHWLVTELGHINTERIHLHGIVFSNFKISTETFQNIWKYGNVVIGDYCNLKTINYIIKYITKIDTDHKNFEEQIFCSSGLGQNYVNRPIIKKIHKFDENTIEYYRTEDGHKINLPVYYRNKLFSEKEREQLWINKLDQAKRFVLGIEIENVDTDKGESRYYRVLKKAREINKKAGFGDDSNEWQKKDYNVTNRMINRYNKVKERHNNNK